MVRRKVLTLGTVGSNPTGAAINDSFIDKSPFWICNEVGN